MIPAWIKRLGRVFNSTTSSPGSWLVDWIRGTATDSGIEFGPTTPLKYPPIWYAVNKGDVFPETFGPFLLGNPQVREVFMAHHAELLDAAFWQGHKERILAGHVHDVFPYEPGKRFAARRTARAA